MVHAMVDVVVNQITAIAVNNALKRIPMILNTMVAITIATMVDVIMLIAVHTFG